MQPPSLNVSGGNFNRSAMSPSHYDKDGYQTYETAPTTASYANLQKKISNMTEFDNVKVFSVNQDGIRSQVSQRNQRYGGQFKSSVMKLN